MSNEGEGGRGALGAGAAAIVRTLRARATAALVALVALAGWASPLTDHLGFASALVAAVVISVAAAVFGAGVPEALRAAGVRASGGAVAALAGGGASGAVLLFALLVAAHGLLGPSCSPGHGAVFFLVLAWPGPVLAALIGANAGAAITRRRWPTVLASLLVPAFVVWSLLRFYASPAVFMYDPFFGFFPGTLYDETIRLTPTMVTHRLGTAGAIVAAAAALVALWDPERARHVPALARARTTAVIAGAAGLVVCLGVYFAGPALGHRYSASEVAEALGGRVVGRRCTVLYARGIDGRNARRTLQDCETRVAQVEAYFALPPGGPVTVFLFADAEQKRRYMGAAETYIAKPWRREVYLQYAAFPHPVLKHEVAHVVAGAMAPGPFRVSMRASVLPLPGLIEGAAVAAAWEGEGDASPDQWSRAMLEAGLLPSMRDLAGVGFLLNASATAYTASGSFSRWLVREFGPARYARVYANGDFSAAYGQSLAALEARWRAYLRTVETPERLLVRARTRFRRAPLQARVCPHETAELLDRAELQLGAGNVGDARAALERVVENDPTELNARADLAEAWARSGSVARAEELAARAERELGPAAGARARLRVADVLWRWGSSESARGLYAAVPPELFDEDEARTLEVKRWVLGVDPPAPAAGLDAAMRATLVGEGDRRPDAMGAVVMLLPLAAGADATGAFAGYTVARQLVGHERPEQALDVLRDARLEALPTARLRAEAQRLIALANYEARRWDEARAAFAQIAADPARPAGARDTARDWVDRIDRERPAPMAGSAGQ